jgi:hypothetical protein
MLKQWLMVLLNHLKLLLLVPLLVQQGVFKTMLQLLKCLAVGLNGNNKNSRSNLHLFQIQIRIATWVVR